MSFYSYKNVIRPKHGRKTKLGLTFWLGLSCMEHCGRQPLGNSVFE